MAQQRRKKISTRVPRDAPRAKVGVETVTPDKAARYLERNQVNRAVRTSLVERFATI